MIYLKYDVHIMKTRKNMACYSRIEIEYIFR